MRCDSNCPNCLSGTNANNSFEACWSLLLTTLQHIHITSTISNFGTRSQFLSLEMTYSVLPSNLIFSFDNNSNL